MARQPKYGQGAAERETLRVLWDNPDEHLVRSEIHRRIPQSHRPTLGRVGQILKRLNDAGLLATQTASVQGSREANVYKLSEAGVELCRDLDFERRELSLFLVPDDEIRETLTRERLRRNQDTPGKIATFYAYRGGLGRTTTIAQVAYGLAEHFRHEKVLVVDLDLGAPGLDGFFPVPPKCRGLGGLFLEYQRTPERKRDLFLRSALQSSDFVCRPVERFQNLVFLPGGVSSGLGALTLQERAEVMDLLRAETWRADSGEGFLCELRRAMEGGFRKTLIDARAGRCLSAWVATQALADEIVLCLRRLDEASSTIEALRAVLASFFRRREDVRVRFVFPMWEPVDSLEFNRWIDRHLVFGPRSTEEPPDYDPVNLVFDHVLGKSPKKWTNSRYYARLTARLGGLPEPGSAPLSPGQERLLRVLDPETPWDRRTIDSGRLNDLATHEFSLVVEWYAHHPEFHRKTDKVGSEKIAKILAWHERQLRTGLLASQDVSAIRDE